MPTSAPQRQSHGFSCDGFAFGRSSTLDPFHANTIAQDHDTAEVEGLRRTGLDASYLFVTKHSVQSVSIATGGHELVRGVLLEGVPVVPAGHARVVREESE